MRTNFLSIILIFSIFLIISEGWAQVIISGPLSGTLQDTTYIVDEDISVPAGDTLVIEPGAEFLFDGHYKFEINGLLLAEGTEEDSIVFTHYNQVITWGGIRFTEEAPDSSILSYCVIEYGDALGSYYPEGRGGGIFCEGTSTDTKFLTIKHCSIRYCKSEQAGGGIYSTYSDIVIDHCVVSYDTTLGTGNQGGGIYCLFGSANIKNSEFRSNRGYYGGGIDISYAASMIENCIISDNTALYGGGINICEGENDDSIIKNCTIENNTATSYYGGGINCLYDANPEFIDCIIKNNSCLDLAFNNARGGGVASTDDSQPIFRNCIITENHSNQFGGGIFGNATVINCVIYNNSAGLYGSGVYAHNPYASFLSFIIKNSIVTQNTNGGIYFSSASNQADYNDFYGNEGDDVYGAIPYMLGQITTVNLNGDSCDIYNNIYLDPLFVDPVSGDFNLQEESPCIDAGDPSSPLDPDSTIADIGAYFFYHGEISLSLDPWYSQIIIPAGGGSFQFDLEINNMNIDSTYIIDFWIMVTLPYGMQYPIFNLENINVPPITLIIREDLTQFVPASVNPGIYTYSAYIRDHYSWETIDADSFTFEKLPGNDSPAHNQGWALYGWDSENFEAVSVLPDHLMIFASPNPFNISTVIQYQLSASRDIKLTVYDITGCELVKLVDSFQVAGLHSVTFDGNNFASGVYFARLQSGKFTRTLKLLLIK